MSVYITWLGWYSRGAEGENGDQEYAEATPWVQMTDFAILSRIKCYLCSTVYPAKQNSSAYVLESHIS